LSFPQRIPPLGLFIAVFLPVVKPEKKQRDFATTLLAS